MGISDVVANADRLLQRGDYAAAISPLEEVIRRTKDLTDEQGKDTVQTCRFQLARAFYQTGDIPAGMRILEDYLAHDPRKQERMALRMMAQGFFDVQEWGKIEEVAKRLLGLPDLQPEDMLNGNLLLGQALFRQSKWVDCIKPLTYTADHSTDERIKGLCQIMIVRAMVESENWRELFAWIPRLYRTDAKYDITLNLTLMKAGKARFEAGEPDDLLNALLLYRMVLPREELLAFANKRTETLSRKLAEDKRIGIRDADAKERQKDIDDIAESVKVLAELPPYEDEVDFRIGQIYFTVKRYWEGYVLFDKLYRKDRASDIGEAAMLQSVLILYEVKEVPRAEERIIRYLEERPDGQYARTLLSIMLRDVLADQKDFPKVIGLRKYIEALPAPVEDEAKELQSDLHYMLSFGYFQNKDYQPSTEQFTVIIEKFPSSPHVNDALYFRGMTFMLQGNYADALSDFKLYQAKNPNGEHFSASMFREAVCLFGLERIRESEAVFTKFIGTFPDDQLVSEAYSMRGDIEAAKDGQDNPNTPEDEYDPHTLDRALADYRKAIDKATTALQSSYPAFQAAKVFKLEFKWQEIIDLMNYYLERWDEMADVSEAVWWVGQSQIELGQVNEAVDAYLAAILRYGNDVSQGGVDKIIHELVKVTLYNLAEADRDGLNIKLNLKLTALDEKQVVLKLRLRVLQALLQGEEAAAALGSELLASNQDLTTTTASSLALMCDAAVAVNDMDQMLRLYEYFIENFEESDLLWHAYRAKTYRLLAKEDYWGVLASIDEAQGLFGAEAHMGWAQIIKADTLYKMNKLEEAEEAYNMVMGVGEWRGPIFAEAMYGMGKCRLGKNDLEAAHSFFQRTYLLFKSYDNGDWAAKSYLSAADCLIKLGRGDDAINTLNAMLEDEYTKENPMADQVREQLKKLGVQ